MSIPPYLVRTAAGDFVAETLEQAESIAIDGYEDAEAIPEIIDDTGKIVFDPSVMIEKVIQKDRGND